MMTFYLYRIILFISLSFILNYTYGQTTYYSRQNGALGLWQAIPERYRQRGIFYTDDWDAYKQIIPNGQHKFGKTKKDTNHVERFFCTLRQRCSRLVRLSLSFSKKIDRHINSIKFVATHYNISLQH